MMNMKSTLTYLAVLTLSFNVFAVEVQEEPKIATPNKVEQNQINSPNTHLATHIVSSHSINEASAEKPDEFMTALSVYLIIIIVYSIYGIKAHSENIRD
ncbi:MAG: hypothetical protein ACXWFF_13010 [Methylomonas sp.]